MSGGKDTYTSSPAKGRLKIRSWLLFFVFFVLVFILVVYYFSEIKKEFILLEKIKFHWLIVAISAQFLTYFFTAFIYFYLLKIYKLSQSPGLWDLLRASVVSLFFNQTVPSAGISGNAFFFNFLARFCVLRAQIISLILTELLIFYAAMETIMVLLLIACNFVYKSLNAFKGILTAGILVYLLFGLIIVFVGRNNILSRLYEKGVKLKFFKRIFERINAGVANEMISKKEIQLSRIIKNNKSLVVRAFFFQLLVVAADAFTLYVLFLGLGHPVSPFIIIITLISTRIISLIPFLPGALILYESSMSFFFTNAGVPLGAAVIVTLVYRLLSFWLPIPIGTLFYREWLKNSHHAKTIS